MEDDFAVQLGDFKVNHVKFEGHTGIPVYS